MNAAIARYTRELDSAARELSGRQRAGVRNLNVRQSWQQALAGMADIQATGAAGRAARGLNTRQSWQRALADMADIQATGAAGRAARGLNTRQSWQRALADMADIQATGAAGRAARGLNTRQSWQRALADMADWQRTNRRALPSSAMLAERVAGTPGGVAPVDLLAQRREQERRAAEELARSRTAGPRSPIGGTRFMVDSPAYNREQERQAQRQQREALRAQREAERQRQNSRLFQGSRRDAISQGLVGGAFPLLFGQGAAASIGGGLGGLGGGLLGGSFGFGLSLIGTALGGVVDTTSQNLKNLAGSFKDPNDAITALEKAGFEVGDTLRFQVEQLKSVGRAYDAQTLVLKEVEKRLGTGAVQELNALNAEQKKLQDSSSILAGNLQRLVIPGVIGFTVVLNDLVTLLNSVGGAGKNRMPITDAIGALFSLTPSGKKAKAAIASAPGRVPLSPQEAFAEQSTRIQESQRLADQVKSAYREAFKLQRQAYDLQRDGADINRDIADYAYKKEREIFDLRQQAAEKQIENARGAAQNRIERGDLGLRQAFSGAVGFEQQLLSNVREVMRTRKEGEADIEQSRKRLELSMVKLGRDAEDYKRANAREIDDIERRKLAYTRSVEDYKMQVADYVLQRTREAAELSRQSAALPEVGAGPGAPAAPGRTGRALPTGAAPNTLMGVPGVLEYLTGDRSSSGYRADHGGSNYHEHIAFASRKIRDDVISMLRRNGIAIGSTDGGRHAPGSYHYSGQAVDIPAAQVPMGKEDALARRVRALVAAHLGGGNIQGRAAGQVSGVPAPTFRPTPLGATPSAAPLSAARMAAGRTLAGGEREAQRILEEQIRLREKGVELGQIEQILQSNQLPQLQQQYDTLRRQVEARRQVLDLSEQGASVADIEAEIAARLAQIEKDRAGALSKARQQITNPQELSKATESINKQAGLALDIAKKEEEQRRKNLDLSNQLQNQDRARAEILQLQEALTLSRVEAAALERGELKATGLELLKASSLYQEAGQAQKDKLAALTAETEELRKQNEFRRQTNELQRDASLVGAGLRAGFIGPSARAFEQGMRDFDGDASKASELANRAALLENQRLVWDNLEKNIVDVSTAISGSLTNGLVDIVSSSKKIEDVGKEMLNNIARSFADSAAQQLNALLQRQLMGLMGGMLGGGGGAGAGVLGSFFGGPALVQGLGQSIPFGGFFANGGTTRPGKGYVVGDGGEPEFFFPGVTGRVVPKSDMEKAAELRGRGESYEPIKLHYTVKEERGERYVTEDQMRKSNAATLKRAQAMTLSGMRNNKEVRDYVGI
jgi:hypothetical protein